MNIKNKPLFELIFVGRLFYCYCFSALIVSAAGAGPVGCCQCLTLRALNQLGGFNFPMRPTLPFLLFGRSSFGNSHRLTPPCNHITTLL